MLTRYQPSGLADLKLYHAWARMLRDGDLQRGFGIEMTLLSAFFSGMQEPTVCWYVEDAQGIWGLFWIQPTSLHAVYFHVWVAAERRGTKATLLATLEAFRASFAYAKVVLVFTNQATLEKTYARFGFQKGGELPEVWNGDTAYFWYLTSDALSSTEARFAKRLGLRVVRSQKAVQAGAQAVVGGV